VNEYFLS